MTGSEDLTIKYWPLSEVDWKKPTDNQTGEPKELMRIISSVTTHAHESDINDITVAPNDKLVATASQDKTVKVFIRVLHRYDV